MVTLWNLKTVKEIYSHTSLLYLKIKVKAYKKLQVLRNDSYAKILAIRCNNAVTQLDVLNAMWITPLKFALNSRTKNLKATTVWEKTAQIIENALFTLT